MIKLIIGLGNPDPEYRQTRHNIGFVVLEYLAKKFYSGSFGMDKKRNALTAWAKIQTAPAPKGKKVEIILAKPLSYVNQSGLAVAKLARFYKVKPRDIIVIHDDLDIEFGSFKNSFEKNSGGHKGVESIIKALKTKKFHRLRIGTAVRALKKAREQTDAKRDKFVVGFVLAKFSSQDKEMIKKMLPKVYSRLLELVKQ